jgi:hypothetical protein
LCFHFKHLLLTILIAWLLPGAKDTLAQKNVQINPKNGKKCLGLGAVKIQFPFKLDQCIAVDAQHGGGFALFAAGNVQCPADKPGFKLLHGFLQVGFF